ncbi:MAG: hypothetical protein Q9183_006225, partial [Haloplaca sp. 2 TL-2023]
MPLPHSLDLSNFCTTKAYFDEHAPAFYAWHKLLNHRVIKETIFYDGTEPHWEPKDEDEKQARDDMIREFRMLADKSDHWFRVMKHRQFVLEMREWYGRVFDVPLDYSPNR